MTDKLPPNLLALFSARPPLRWVPPSDHAPQDRKTATITGVAAFLPQLEEYKKTDVYKPTESWLEARDRKKLEKKQKQEDLIKNAPLTYKPHEDPNIRGDAFKTLIVARLSYEATEQDLESEFGRFGPIERIRIVVDTHQDEKPNKKKKKHRGYAFVVYEREKDMRAALDNCDGIRIKDRRIKVDVERGRTVKNFRPARLGGGLGSRGYTKAPVARPAGPGSFAPAGGFRGRGGFDGPRGRGGGFRGGFQDKGGYGRGGIGYQGGGFPRSNGAPPPNAPSGPGFARGGVGGGFGRGGHGGDRNGPGIPASGGYDSRRSFDDRSGGYRGNRDYNRGGNFQSGSNSEPVRPREYRDRDRDGGGYDARPREEDSRKRQHESNGYDDPRKLRRY